MDTDNGFRTRPNTARAVSAVAVLLALGVLFSGGPLAYAQFPSADLRVWNGSPSSLLGSNPDESVADPTGLSSYVATLAAPLTIVTVYENTTCPGGPCGIVYWNPVTNTFKCVGVTGGFQAAVDINRTAPVKTNGPATFQPGDAWASGPTSFPIYVVFKGPEVSAGCFPAPCAKIRAYFVGDSWGVEVDQSTGNVLFAARLDGSINRLDPATNVRTRWGVGGNPHYLTRDSLGRIYATVANSGGSGVGHIVRVDPSLGSLNVARWDVPGTDFLNDGFQTPNGITIDANGNIWFTETLASQVARLSAGGDGILGTADDQICQFTKTGLSNPQLVATSGSDAPASFALKNLQVYFTEGSGNAVSVLTNKEAVGTCATVAPVISTVTPTTSTVSISDMLKPVRTVTITPTTHTIPGVDGSSATGTTMTAGPDGIPGNADDEVIPGILRFPFTAVIGSGHFPSGMTEVAAGNTVYGSFLFTSRLFELKSRAIIAPPPVNSPPTVAAASPSVTVPEGTTATNSGTFSDPNAGDTVTITASTGIVTQTGTNSGTWSWSLPTTDNFGPLTVTITATDNNGASATTTFTVTATNVAPSVGTPTLSAASINENDTVTATVNFSDPGTGDTFTATIFWGDGTSTTIPIGASPSPFKSFSASHQYLDDNPTATPSDSNTITVTVTDDDGGTGGASTSITVNNVAPVVGAVTGPASPLALGTSASVSLGFTDVGTQDTHTCSVSWDDSTTSAGTVTEAGGSGSCTASRTYAGAGVYTVTMTITDDDTGAASSIFQFIVVFDPSAGFVTGGGTINSPAGAFTADPTLTGKANFGFNAKYQKGATIPTGQTEFQFKAGDLNFHSSAYEWLVVAGARAQYKGTGTINGAGSFGFLLTLVDGQVSGGGGVDKFRIRITTAGGGVVYDNVPAAGLDMDSANPQALATGSIVIHSGGPN